MSTIKLYKALTPCGECGMLCDPKEYHPYAACLMFEACHNSETVRANLEAVRRNQPTQAQANCWCETCDLLTNGPLRTRMSICPNCGDKRCPRAALHYAACQKHPPPVATHAQTGAVPLTDAQKREMATNWFAEDWAVSKAMGLIDDYETLQGITKEGGKP